MKTSQTLQELRSELKTRQAEVSTLEEAIAALERFQKLAQPNTAPKPNSGRQKAPQAPQKASRRQIPKTCPVCGYQAANGAGLSAHLRSRHTPQEVEQAHTPTLGTLTETPIPA